MVKQRRNHCHDTLNNNNHIMVDDDPSRMGCDSSILDLEAQQPLHTPTKTTTTTTTNTSSLSLSSSNSKIIFRPIQPSDRIPIQQLHEEWFPVTYQTEFYDELVYGRLHPNGDYLYTNLAILIQDDEPTTTATTTTATTSRTRRRKSHEDRSLAPNNNSNNQNPHIDDNDENPKEKKDQIIGCIVATMVAAHRLNYASRELLLPLSFRERHYLQHHHQHTHHQHHHQHQQPQRTTSSWRYPMMSSSSSSSQPSMKGLSSSSSSSSSSPSSATKTRPTSPPTSSTSSTTSTTACYIMTLGTAPEYRKLGLATMLVKQCIQDMVLPHPGCGALYLHVITTNPAAIAFYEQDSLRFHRVKEIPNYYTIDDEFHNCYLYAKYFHGNHGHLDIFQIFAHWISIAWSKIKKPLLFLWFTHVTNLRRRLITRGGSSSGGSRRRGGVGAGRGDENSSSLDRMDGYSHDHYSTRRLDDP